MKPTITFATIATRYNRGYNRALFLRIGTFTIHEYVGDTTGAAALPSFLLTE